MRGRTSPDFLRRLKVTDTSDNLRSMIVHDLKTSQARMAITQSDSEGVTLNTPAARPAGQRAQQASAHLLCTSFPAEIRVLHDMYKYKCTYDTQESPETTEKG